MAIDLELNKILKEMWRLDEKMTNGHILGETEMDFYNKNLQTIQEYYIHNSEYWTEKNFV